MKKLLTIVLSLIIVATSLFSTQMLNGGLVGANTGELIFDGSFETTRTVVKAEDYSTVTYDSAHIWYRAGGDRDVYTDTNYAANFGVYQSVKIKENTDYVLTFKAKNINGSSSNTIKPQFKRLKDRSKVLVLGETITVSESDWKTFTATLSVKDFAAGVKDYTMYLETSTADVAMDNISLMEKDKTEELLFDGSFNETTTVVKAEDYGTVTYESAHIWYRAGGDMAVFSEVNYAANFGIYQSVKLKENTDYFLSFKAKNINGSSSNTIKPQFKRLKDRSKVLVLGNAITVSESDWKTFTAVLSVKDFAAGVEDYTMYLETSTADVAMDDISLKEMGDVQLINVKLNKEGNGSATASTLSGVAGTEVTFTATPDDGEEFLGWFVDGSDVAVSSDATYKTTLTDPSKDYSITAKFTAKTNVSMIYDGGFDATETIPNAPGNTSDFNVNHIWYKVNGLENAVITEANGNKAFTMLGYIHQSVRFEKNKEYVLSFKAKKTADTDEKKATFNVAVCKASSRGDYSATGGDPVQITIDLQDTFKWYSVTLKDLELAEGLVYSLRMWDSGCINKTDVPNLLLDDFSLIEKGSDNLVYDGGFDATASVNAAPSNTSDFATNHIWYRVNGKNDVVITEADNNKALTMMGYIHQSVKVENGKSYILRFKAKKTAETTNTTAELNIAICKTSARADYSAINGNVKKVTIQLIDTYKEDYAVILPELAIADNTLYSLRMWDPAVINNTAVPNILIDDFSLVEAAPVGVMVKTEGNGEAEASTYKAPLGSEVAFTATPAGGESFAGWFVEGKADAVSTETTYKTVLNDFTKDFQITAKFSKNVKEELIFDGGFDATAAIGAAPSNTSEFATNHIWYRVNGTDDMVITEADGNKALTPRGYIHQAVKFERGGNYAVTFRAKKYPGSTKASAKLGYSVVRTANRADTSAFAATETTLELTDEYQIYHFFMEDVNVVDGVLYSFRFWDVDCTGATSNINMIIDDIKMYQLGENSFSVEATSFRSGSVEVDAIVATPDMDVTFTATPDPGSTFVGWFNKNDLGGEPVSKDLIYKTRLTENTSLFGIFASDKYPTETYKWNNMDAELGNTSGWVNNTNWESAGVNMEFGVSSEEKNGGNYAFEVKANAPRQAISTADPILLKGDYKYEISCWIKTTDDVRIRPVLSTAPQYIDGVTDFVHVDVNIRPEMKISHIIGSSDPNIRQYGSVVFTRATEHTPGRNEEFWVKYTMSFEVLPKYAGAQVYLGFRNQTTVSEMDLGINRNGTFWIDDVTVKETLIDYSPFETDATYSEFLYNMFEEADFEKGIEATNLGEVPGGFTVEKENDNSYLKVAANSGAHIIKLNVMKDTWYTFGYDWKTNKQGSSYVGFFVERPSDENLKNPAITQRSGAFYPKTVNQWQRSGFKLYTKYYENVYLVIYGGSNDLYLDNLFFFKTEAFKENPTSAPLIDFGDEEDLEYDELYLKYVNYKDSENVISPETGDSAAAPAIAIMLSLLAAVALITLRKGGKKYEK